MKAEKRTMVPVESYLEVCEQLKEKEEIIKVLLIDLNQQIGYTKDAYQLGVKDCSDRKDKEIAELHKATRILFGGLIR